MYTTGTSAHGLAAVEFSEVCKGELAFELVTDDSQWHTNGVLVSPDSHFGGVEL